MMQTIGVRLNVETISQVNELALRRKRKSSEVIRLIVENYFEHINHSDI